MSLLSATKLDWTVRLDPNAGSLTSSVSESQDLNPKSQRVMSIYTDQTNKAKSKPDILSNTQEA